MTTVVEDLERGHSLQFINRETELVRAYHVSGLVSNPDGQLLEAIQDPAIPAMSDVHPQASGLFVVRKRAVPAGRNTAYVECIYSNTSGATWNQPTPTPGADGEDVKQISSSVVSERRTRDRGNQPMTMSPPASVSGWPQYLSEAEVFRPVGELVFERSEGEVPAQRARTLVGKVNQFAIGAYGAEELLFARFNSISTDGGRVWRSTYNFRHDPRQWKHRDTYKGDDNKSPPDATEVLFDVLELADFSVLNLDFSDAQTPI